MKKFDKMQFAAISSYKDPITGLYSKTIEDAVAKEFEDGYAWGFDATANRAYQSIKCVYRKSIEGKHCVFFYYGKDRNFHSFVCGDTLGEALWKVNDLAFWK